MKVAEIIHNKKGNYNFNYTIPITNEESDVLDKFDNTNLLLKSSLSDREQLLANNLVVKDVLLRTKQDGKIAYEYRHKRVDTRI